MKISRFYKQAKLMMECLPIVARFQEFALKGGTAINFFERDLPRLSVDIDLTYLPILDRNTSLINITKMLEDIAVATEKELPGSRVTKSNRKDEARTSKLFVVRDGVQVKIEPNEVVRGSVYDSRLIAVTDKV